MEADIISHRDNNSGNRVFIEALVQMRLHSHLRLKIYIPCIDNSQEKFNLSNLYVTILGPGKSTSSHSKCENIHTHNTGDEE